MNQCTNINTSDINNVDDIHYIDDYTYERFVAEIQQHMSSKFSMTKFEKVPEIYIQRLILNNTDISIDYMYCHCFWKYISAGFDKTLRIMPNWYMKYFNIAFTRMLKDMKLIYRFFNRSSDYAVCRYTDLYVLEPYITETILTYSTKFIDYNLTKKDICEIAFFFDMFYQYYSPKQVIKFLMKLKKADINISENVLEDWSERKFLNEKTQLVFNATLNLMKIF